MNINVETISKPKLKEHTLIYQEVLRNGYQTAPLG